jgi:hypothetical protein
MSKIGAQYTPVLSAAYLKSLAPSTFQCTTKLKSSLELWNHNAVYEYSEVITFHYTLD